MRISLVAAVIGISILSTRCDDSSSQSSLSGRTQCQFIETGFGPTGKTPLHTETLVDGLSVPWAIAFLPNGDWLVTERVGQLRRVSANQLQTTPVLTLNVEDNGEGGLLGLTLHPDFSSNRLFYLYYTTRKGGSLINRVERFQLSTDNTSATADRIIVDDIPAAATHDGGRIHFGPDGLLYIGTGDAGNPNNAQNPNSLSGKILRVTPDGAVPSNNPQSGNPMFIMGLRNNQGFDWINSGLMILSDHGPTGELGGRTGGDEINFARSGDNLGWPTTWRCAEQSGFVSPSLTWRQSLPPASGILYRGSAIPEWQGSYLVGTLVSQHLHRIIPTPSGDIGVQSHEVYLANQFGRLREVAQAPDGSIYITTSNCDGRGSCPAEGDQVIRITKG